MDLRLEDYARKEGREWYEILRNHVKEKPEKTLLGFIFVHLQE